MITLQNLCKHEFIGLSCSVTSASNKYNSGISGRVIDETMKTLTLDVKGVRKKVQKKGTKFAFRVPGKKKKVVVDGNSIIARPEDRIKKKIKVW